MTISNLSEMQYCENCPLDKGNDLGPWKVENTELSIIIERIDTPEGPDDFITTCEFTSLDTDLLMGTKLYCKLYDGVDIEAAFIIATGFVKLDQLVQMGTVIPIQITDLSFEDSNNMDFVANVLVEVQEP